MKALSSLLFTGHSGIIITCADGYTIGIDPWLQGCPTCPKELQNPERLDLIVLTHGHADHASDAVRLAKKCNSKVAATYELVSLLVEEGVSNDRAVYMNKGGTVVIDDIPVTLTHAYHSSSFDTSKGTKYAGEACGVIVQGTDQRIYHAGDTALFSDMTLIRDSYHPTLALFPIGDRFTMGPKEAAIAAGIIGASLSIPIHYGTFPLLTGTPEAFVRECSLREREVKVLAPGEQLEL